MGSMAGERRSSHASATWAGVAPTARATSATVPRRADNVPSAMGNHGMKPMPSVSQCSRTSSDRRLARLYRFWTETMGTTARARLDLGHGDLGQSNVAHLALVAQLLEDPELLGGGDLGVDAVQLEEVDALQAQPAQAHQALLTQVLGTAHRWPLGGVGTDAGQPRLGPDHEPVRIRVQRFADELLGHVRAVGVGGVDEVHAELDGTTQHPDALVVVLGWAPDPGPGDPHGSEGHPVDGQVAEHERSARGHRPVCLRGHVHLLGAPPPARLHPSICVSGQLCLGSGPR